MKKGEIREGIVSEVKFPNKGNVRLLPKEGEEDGRDEWATVKNVLPGQKISIMIGKVRKGRGEGRALCVLEPSPDEIQAPCPHFGSCGGCIYLSLPYEKQLELKERQVKELLDAALVHQEKPWTFEPIKGSPMPLAYRNKMEFSFGDEYKDGPLALGMHKRGSFYDIVTVSGCQIVDEDYRQILSGTQEYFSQKEISFFHRLSHKGYLRHLLVRKAAYTKEILVGLVTTSQIDCEEERALLDGFVQMLQELPLSGKLAGILHIRNNSVADVVKSDETTMLFGQDFFYEELLGMKFRISVFSFFQTNSYGAQVLYQTARDYIGELGKEDCVVYDLYSGTGTIAQMMAPAAGKVIGVEIVEEAVEAARENAALNGLDNCTFIAGDVLKVLDEITEKPDFIILDPPRDGIHPKALQKIIRYGVDRILYISCKPTSLARDLEVLVENGYAVERAGCVDMFPGTGNVETVVLLSHKKPDGHINVKVEFGEGEGKVPLDNIAKRAEAYKPKERVTYKMIKEYIEAKYGFKVHTAYIAEVKRSLGLPMYDAPNAVEELKQPRKHPTAEKVEAIKDALRHFELV